MTTLAFSASHVAADSLMCYGTERIGCVDKIRVAHGRIYAICGDFAVFEALIAWHNAGADPERAPKASAKDGSWSLYVIERSLSLTAFGSELPYPIPLAFPQAWGSGGNYARALLEAGFSAEDAVVYACRLDIYTGLPVKVIAYADVFGQTDMEAAE